MNLELELEVGLEVEVEVEAIFFSNFRSFADRQWKMNDAARMKIR
jgi:hypothetical protein